MKKLFLLVLISAICAVVLRGQTSSSSFSFQAVIRDTEGKAVGNKIIPLEFIIKNGKNQIAYSERQSPTTDAFGLISTVVGNGIPTTSVASIDKIDWSQTPFTLMVNCDADGNGSFEELASGPILSGPFSNTKPGAGLDSITGDGKFIIVEKKRKDSLDYLVIKLNDVLISGLVINSFPGIKDSINKYFIPLPKNPQNGQVLKYDGSGWSAGTDLTTTGSGAAATAVPLIGNGSANSPITLGQNGALNNQVLKWNGTSWIPANDNNDTYSAGSGILISGNNQISNTGDTNASDDLTNATNFSGDVTGVYNNLQLGAGVVGDSELANASITAAKIAQNGASNGQVLKWNGNGWFPSTDNEGNASSYSAGNGISINGNNQISNTGDTNASDDLTNATNFSGDVTGVYNNLQLGAGVVGASELANASITGAKLAQDGASDGQVLQYKSGVGWKAATFSSTGLTASTVFGGDVSGPYNNLQLGTSSVGNPEIAAGSITLDKITAVGAVPGDIIRRDKSGWVFTSLPGTSGSASGDLSGTYPGPTVNGIRGVAVPSIPGADQNNVYWLQVNPTFGGTTFTWRTAPNLNLLNSMTSDGSNNISSLPLIPLTDNSTTLGASKRRWSAVYSTNGTIQTSDLRQKKNVSPLKLGLAQVLSLNPVYYNWKTENDSSQKHLGFIAQEVLTVVPEVVNHEVNDGQDIYGMKYSELIPVLVNAIKEQQAQIDELKRKLEKLKSE